MSVDLPEPFLPVITADSPLFSLKFKPVKIVFPEYFLERFSEITEKEVMLQEREIRNYASSIIMNDAVLLAYSLLSSYQRLFISSDLFR